MKILLFGKNGQLGWELHRTLATLGEVLVLDYPEIDLAKLEAIPAVIEQARPQLVVNAAAYTAVDRAESEQELAMAVNGRAPGLMAEACASIGAILIHFSTDYVFDGQQNSPYRETAQPRPVNAYGNSKLAGERAIAASGCTHLILRTSWVYSLRGNSFVNKVLEWSQQRPVLSVVDDQVGSPTWARALAEATAQLLAIVHAQGTDWLQARQGIYHLAGSGCTSRYEWARTILRSMPGRDKQILQELLPAKTVEFPTPARRPLYTALNCEKFFDTFGLRLPPWEIALQMALETERKT